MRVRLNRWLLPMGLATATLLGTVSTAAAQPVVRDHRGPRDHTHQPAGAPREAPPAPRAERQGAQRRGFVWVSGHWDWNGGRWEWSSGRWERERRGRRWRPLTWENRAGVYVRVNGDWIDDRPTQAPPAPREERFEPRRGWVWIAGHWDWHNGQYVWSDGAWERERRGKRWRSASWELRNGAWVRIDGGWDDDVVQYPTQAPPPPREERQAPRQGFVWIRGRHEWRNGQYAWVSGRWERERTNERYIDGRWEYRDQRWMWIDGRWDRAGYTWADGTNQPWPEYPVEAPPRARAETDKSAPGKVWFPGRYLWREGKYQWSPGTLVNARSGYRFVPGTWDLRANGRWTWNNESWLPDNSRPPQPMAQPMAQPVPQPVAQPVTQIPVQPPPPPREERYERKDGFVWARGHYEWRGGQYEWIPGHWERVRANQTYEPPRWELRGKAYVRIEGGWR